tara:strand:+ start:50364 stop:50999 length:636 start_codon:yes stop_codon:yes gene_type:complete
MKKIEIMKPVDQWVYTKLDELSNNPEVSKFLDQYANLDEKVQDIIKNLLVLAIILLPTLFIMILWSFNSSLKSELAIKKETLTVAQEIVSKQAKLGTLKRRYFNTTAVKSQAELQSKISGALASSGIDSNKINLGGYQENLEGADIVESRVDLKFNKFSNEELFNLLASLNVRLKAKVEEISIKKNTTDNLLEGIIHVIYYGEDKQPMDDF